MEKTLTQTMLIQCAENQGSSDRTINNEDRMIHWPYENQKALKEQEEKEEEQQ